MMSFAFVNPSANSFLESASYSMKANKRCFILHKGKKGKNAAKCMRKRSNNSNPITEKTTHLGFRRLKVEMEEMSKEQQSIKEAQRQVHAKFNAIEDECEQLHQETQQIIRQSENNQIRLALMFSILKAREQGDVEKDAQLTGLLREIVARDDSQNEDSPH